jgi:hypothetical protein
VGYTAITLGLKVHVEVDVDYTKVRDVRASTENIPIRPPIITQYTV